MSTTHHASTSTARSATIRFATTLGLAIALLASPAAQARATLSTGAAPAALAQPQHASEGSGIAQRQQASESKVLPAPFLVAPGCPGCRLRGGQGAGIDDVLPAFENKALPAPFLVAPDCGSATCLRDRTKPIGGFGFKLLAGGDPTTVVDSWGWPRPRG